MKMKTVAAVALFFFLFSSVTSAQQATSIREPVSSVGQGVTPSTKGLAKVDGGAGAIQVDLNPYNIAIPEELGAIEEVSQGAIGSPLIIHIQNVHANYEAQVNIKQILNHLITKYNFSLIQVEGAASKLNPEVLQPSYLREANLKLVDLLLRQGRITGADAFAVETEKPVAVYGIEDYSLYMENVKIFRQIYGHQGEVSAFFSAVHRLNLDIGPKLFSPELLDFTRKTEEFSTDRIDLLDYLLYMNGLSEKHKLVSLYDLKEMTRYPNLVRLMRLEKLEGELSRSGLKQETAALKLEFEKKMPGSEKAKELLFRLDEKAKGVNPRSYFLELTKLADEAQINFISYPAFRIFAEFLIHQDEIDHRGLFSELKAFEKELQEKLFVTEGDKAYLEIIGYTGLLEQYFQLQMSREKLALYVDHQDEIKPSRIAMRLEELAGKHAVRTIPLGDAQKLDSYMDELEYFYQLVLKRDEIFVDKILERMSSLGQKSTILVTGGFHKDGLMDHYKKENISYVIVSPKVNVKEGNENYLKVMLEEEAAQGSVFTGTFAAEVSHLTNPDQRLSLAGAFQGSAAETLHLGGNVVQVNEKFRDLVPKAGLSTEVPSQPVITGFRISYESSAKFFDEKGEARRSDLATRMDRLKSHVAVNLVNEGPASREDLIRLGLLPPEPLRPMNRIGLPKFSTISGLNRIQRPTSPPVSSRQFLERSIVLQSSLAPVGGRSELLDLLGQVRDFSSQQISELWRRLKNPADAAEVVVNDIASEDRRGPITEEGIVLAGVRIADEGRLDRLRFFSTTGIQPGVVVAPILGNDKAALLQLKSLIGQIGEKGAAAVVYGRELTKLVEGLKIRSEVRDRIKIVDVGSQAEDRNILERMIKDLQAPGLIYNLYLMIAREIGEGSLSRSQFMNEGYVRVLLPEDNPPVAHPLFKNEEVKSTEAVSYISKGIPVLLSAMGRPMVSQKGLEEEFAVIEFATLSRLPRNAGEAKEFLEHLRQAGLLEVIISKMDIGKGIQFAFAADVEVLVQQLFRDYKAVSVITSAA